MIEYGGADGLFGPVLSNDVVIDTLLQVPWVEPGDAILGLVEHGAAAGLERRVIAGRETGGEILIPSIRLAADG